MADKQTTIPANAITLVPIQLKLPKQLPQEQDFLFQPIAQRLNLGPQSSPRAHIVDFKLAVVEVQNATDCPVIIPRKKRLGKIINYEEEDCYAVSVEEAHLAAEARWPRHRLLAATCTPQPAKPIEKHKIGFTAYRMQGKRDKLFVVA